MLNIMAVVRLDHKKVDYEIITQINKVENKKAKPSNYQGGDKSSYIEIFKWFIYLYTDKSQFTSKMQ